jgi:hypothetical protein
MPRSSLSPRPIIALPLALTLAAACGDTTDARTGAVCNEPARCPLVTVLAEQEPGGQQLTALALDATHVYFTDAWNLRRVPKGGGAVETLATGLGATGTPGRVLAVDDERVYLAVNFYAYGELLLTSERGAIVSVPKRGGDYTVLADRLWQPASLTLDDGVLYFVTQMIDADPQFACGPAGDLFALDTRKGELRTLARLLWQPTSLAVLDEHVYVGHAGTLVSPCGPEAPGYGPRRISRVAKAGGALELLVMGDDFGPGLQVLDDQALYATGLVDGIDTLRVSRYVPFGAAPERLADLDVRDFLLGGRLVARGDALYLPLQKYHTADGARAGTVLWTFGESFFVRLDKHGHSAPVALGARFTGPATDLALDDQALYVVNDTQVLRILDDQPLPAPPVVPSH